MKRILSYNELIEIANNEPNYFFQIFKNYVNAIINKKIIAVNKNNKYIYIYKDKSSNYLTKLLSIKYVPNLNVEIFIDRLIDYITCSMSCFVFTMYHIFYIYKNKIINIDDSNIYKVLIVTLLLSIKFLEDKPMSIKKYSFYVGITSREIAFIERQLLKEFDYNINIDNTYCFLF